MSVQPLALLVEDEAFLVMLIEEEFADAGFRVFSSLHGTAALAELDSDAEQFFCLVTDIRLGTEIDGWAVAEHARKKNPDILVVYVTGDSAGAWPTKGVSGSVLLNKPLVSGQLTKAVTNLMDQNAAVSVAAG